MPTDTNPSMARDWSASTSKQCPLTFPLDFSLPEYPIYIYHDVASPVLTTSAYQNGRNVTLPLDYHECPLSSCLLQSMFSRLQTLPIPNISLFTSFSAWPTITRIGYHALTIIVRLHTGTHALNQIQAAAVNQWIATRRTTTTVSSCNYTLFSAFIVSICHEMTEFDTTHFTLPLPKHRSTTTSHTTTFITE